MIARRMIQKSLPRFSLLTAIVLMFAAGSLVFLNTRRQKVRELIAGSNHILESRYGWPVLFFYSSDLEPLNVDDKYYFDWRIDLKFALLDLAIALAILTVVGIISEKIVRRHEARARLNRTVDPG